MTFKPLFVPITKLSLHFVTFRASRFPVSHLTHETVKLCLQNTLYMSKMTRVYFGVLHTGFTLLIKSEVIGYVILCNGLYLIQLQNDNGYNSLSLTFGIKRSVMNEESSLLWHRRLGHISIQRIIKISK